MNLPDISIEMSESKPLSIAMERQSSGKGSIIASPFIQTGIKSSQSTHESLHHQTHCPLCDKSIAKMTDSIPIRKLKPRFLRQIKRQYPNKNLKDLKTRVCYKDLHAVLLNRIDDLLEADQVGFAKMQEEAMVYLSSSVRNHNTRSKIWRITKLEKSIGRISLIQREQRQRRLPTLSQ